jgi:hypothetical protein
MKDNQDIILTNMCEKVGYFSATIFHDKCHRIANSFSRYFVFRMFVYMIEVASITHVS